MPGVAILSQGAGYGIVCGIGAFFTLAMVALTKLQTRYTKFKTTSLSEFASASHSVKPGLIACAIVSSWTWAATLLQSSAMGYKTGLVGPYAYAAGATVQILLFSMNAAKIKLNAPKAHTFLEVIRVRWGTTAHIVFGVFSFVTSTIVSAMLITGGSATVNDLTGANTDAICILIPLGVCIYVLIGGLRSSLLADFVHTSALFAIILAFQFIVFTSSDKIGSPGKMWDLLVQASKDFPVEGNKEGSYLTFYSKTGMIFMVINLIGNFATVFNDQVRAPELPSRSALTIPLTRTTALSLFSRSFAQAYWQRAVASQPSTAVKAYMLGGSAWLSIPLGFAATMGLSAVVLRYDPSYPNYPAGLSASEVSAGLPAAAAAQTLMAQGGAAMLLVLLFLAVTSAASAELCAVSTLFSYDVFVTYIKPDATEKQVLFADHCAIVGYAAFMGVLGIAFNHAGVSMGWLYEMMGVICGSAVVPIACCIMWRKANKYACIAGAIVGFAAAVTGWLASTYTLFGELNMTTTLEDYSMLTGNVLAFCVGGLTSIIGSLIWPEDYSFEETRALHAYNEATEETAAAPLPDGTDAEKEKSDVLPASAAAPVDAAEHAMNELDSPAAITKTFKTARWVAIIGFVVLMIIIPLPLVGSGYIATKVGFTTYVVISIIWVFYGAAAVVLYPVWEYRHSISEICRHMWADIRGKKAE
ncbi:hypothetical protein JCM10213_001841 [Rhodosporidiobolus nylandii]